MTGPAVLPPDPWMEATGLRLPRPPGPATTLVEALGPAWLLATTPHGHERFDRGVLVALLEALGRPVRAGEHEALLWVTPVPEGGLVEAMTSLVRHPSDRVRLAAVAWLGGTPGRPLEPLWEALDDPDDAVHVAAVNALGRRAPAEALQPLAVRPWRGDAADRDRVRALAPHAAEVGRWLHSVPAGGGRALLEAGCAAVEGKMGPLLAALEAGPPEAADALATWLAARPDLAEEAVEHVAQALRRATGPAPGLEAALAAAGVEGREVAVALLEAESPAVRRAGAAVLGLQAAAGRPAHDPLAAALDDEDPDVQREATLAMLAGDPGAEGLRQRLLRTLVRAEGFLSRAEALGVSLGPIDALFSGRPPGPELLALCLAPGDERLRAVACVWMGRHLGSEAGATLEALARDARRQVPLAVRRGAAAGVRAAGLAPRDPVVARLLLAHAGAGVPASEGLAGRGGELLRVAMTDADGVVRAAALDALARGPDPVAPFEAAIAWLAGHDPDPAVREAAHGLVPPRWRADDLGAAVRAVVAPPPGASVGARVQALRRVWSEAPSWGRAVAQALPVGDDARALAREAARLQGAALRGAEAVAAARRALVALDDPRWAVREAAADLLGALTPADLPPALQEELAETLAARAVSDYDGDVQAAAAVAAARLGGGAS